MHLNQFIRGIVWQSIDGEHRCIDSPSHVSTVSSPYVGAHIVHSLEVASHAAQLDGLEQT